MAGTQRAKVPMRLEQLEAREVPAIVQTGLPSWLPAGPAPAVGSTNLTGIPGPTDPFTAVPDGDPLLRFTNPATGPADEIELVPGDPNTVFVGAAGGGIWRTRDALSAEPTWVPLTDGLPSLTIDALDINPQNPNQMIAGVAPNASVLTTDSGDLIGVYVTENALADAPTFRRGRGLEVETAPGQFFPLSVRAVLARNGYTSRVSGVSVPAYMLAGTNGGVYRSVDGGATFLPLNGSGNLPFFTGDTLALAADPSEPGRVYALTTEGLFRTEDVSAGVPFWVNITRPFMQLRSEPDPFPTLNGKISIHTSPGFNVVYVAVGNLTGRIDNLVAGRLVSVSYSTDAGSTFTPMDLPENLSPNVLTVTGASFATPIQITTAEPHNLFSNDRVQIAGVTGNFGANANFTVTVTGPTTFTLNGSVGTGVYTGGGTARAIVGINLFGGVLNSLALKASPTDPFAVFIGGDAQDTTGAFGASIQRGDRRLPRTNGNLIPSPQWTPITGVNAGGTAPHFGVRDLEVDAFGRLIAGTDGGVYARASASDNTSPWQSAVGNLSLAQMLAVGYDPLNNALFGNTIDSGTVDQVSGLGPVGSNFWRARDGASFIAEADTTTIPGATIRYSSLFRLIGTRRSVFGPNNQLISTEPVRFLDALTGQSALVGEDLTNNDVPLGREFFVLNAVDPRLVMAGRNALYEDDNPAGSAGDTVAVVTPAGLAGRISAIVYGGRLAGQNVTRAAYVGTESGQLFARSLVGGFGLRPVPGVGEVTAIAVDPDDFLRVYVARNQTQVFFSTDGGFTWTDITQNLVTSQLEADGSPVLFAIDPLTGLPRGGLTTAIRSLAVYDPTPGGAEGGGVTLIAGGRNGVFRFVPGLNPTPGFGWTEYGLELPNAPVIDLRVFGNRLVAGTVGRGTWVIPDISGSINQAATVDVVGGDGDDVLTLTADPRNPNNVVVSDGMGNFLSVGRSNSPRVRFFGGNGADLIQILGSDAPGGDLSFLSIPVFIDAGSSVGDRILIRDGRRATPTVVTVNAGTVGALGGDTLFSGLPGAFVTYVGLTNGTLEVDLGDALVGGTVNLQSTSAARTRLVGSTGQDTFVLNSLAGFSAAEVTAAVLAGLGSELAFINGLVEIDGRGGNDGVILGDNGAKSGNANVVVQGGVVTGFTGGGDTGVVTVANVGSLNLLGSNDSSVAETFTLINPSVPTTLFTFAGNDTVNVRANTQSVVIDTGAGDDLVRVGSLAGVSDDGTLAGIVGPLFIETGPGTNRVVISDAGSSTRRNYVVNATTLTGATPNPITFLATGGRLAGPGGSGVTIRGGNADDTFTVGNIPAGAEFLIDGGGGNDVFAFDNKTTLGRVRFEGGAGDDALAFDPGTAGNKATGVTFDGGPGNNGLRFLGANEDDAEASSITLTGPNEGFFLGRGQPFPFAGVGFVEFDGRAGTNSLTLVNAAGISRSVVFTPSGLTSGGFAFDGGAFRVGLLNVNGGLTYLGSLGGNGPDVLTYQGFSDIGAGANPTTAGGDDLFITDSQITNFNDGLGEIIPLNIGRDNGLPTIAELRVLTGDEVGGGDRVGVRPSDDIPIFIDGQGPNRAPGDKLAIFTGGGAPVTAINFENRPLTRNVYAVGADAGGGPRVRVYDSNTNQVLFDQFVYDERFTGGVRVATGDVTGDGIPDLVTAAGFGGGPHIRVFDGATFALISEFFAYEDFFRGGAFVAVADLAGTGISQIVTGAGNGGGPLVKIFNADGSQVRAFFAYADNFRGGVRVAAGDVNGDGFADIVTGAGIGGGPHVRVFNAGDGRVLTEYLAYDPAYRGGVYVAAGDVDGDGFADIITGPGDNTLPNLTFRSSLDGGALVQVNPFLAIDNAPARPVPAELAAFNQELGGIRVTTTANNDGSASRIIATRGPGFPPRLVNYFAGPGLGTAFDGGLAFEEAFIGGLYVG